MNIGEFARRLGVSRRAVRHYEAIGLLAPAAVDERSGYRRYGPAELIAGVQIEQLKAAGLALGEIRAVLTDDDARDAVLERRAGRLQHAIEQQRGQLALLTALRADRTGLSPPSIVARPATPVVTARATSAPDALTPCVRREVQRLRRRVRHDDRAAPWTFAARFPIERRGDVTVEVAATHPSLVSDGEAWPGGDAITVTVTGPHTLLPIAHDAALASALAAGRTPAGTIRETYARFGPVPVTTIDVVLLARER